VHVVAINQQAEETPHGGAVTPDGIKHSRMNVPHVGPVFDTAADAVVLLDVTGVIVAANLATTQMFRCDEAQLLGTPALQWVAERHRARHLADMRALAEGQVGSVNRGWVDESHAVRFDGEEFPIEVTKSELVLAGQRLQTLTVRDVSLRKQVRDAVFNSRAKLAAALANIRDAVCISDAQGRNLEFNDSFVSLNRFKSRQECNTTLAELHAGFDFTTVSGAPLPVKQRPIYRALNGDDGVGIDFKVRRKDTGETWIASYSFGPIRDEYGAITGAVITARDVTAERELLTQLKSSRSELRRLVACQNTAAEEERKRIARDLHDDLQQTLAAVRLNVAAVEQRVRSVSSDAAQAAAQALALSESAILSTRLIIAGLRPQILDDLGLLAALASTLSDFGERHGVESDFDVIGQADAALPAEAATCLYRIAQEALQNIGKHARAGCVVCTLDLSDPSRAVLQIHDDGVGIRPADLLKPNSVGVLGMDERLRAIGGTLRVMPGEVSGTTVEAMVPLPAGPEVTGDGY
jgi:PAS domain S-box-containing protein